MPWEQIAAYTGFPAVLKPAIGGGWKNVSVVHNMQELLRAYDASGPLLMILQEFIKFELYARCFVIGRQDVLISGYDPTVGHFDRYLQHEKYFSPDLEERMRSDCLTLCRALGYDMNTVEFAIRDGIPYAIDFLNPAPDFDISSLKERYFEWVLDRMASLVIEYATGERKPPEYSAESGTMRWQTLINAVPALPE
jgi:hypothetical protein